MKKIYPEVLIHHLNTISIFVLGFFINNLLENNGSSIPIFIISSLAIIAELYIVFKKDNKLPKFNRVISFLCIFLNIFVIAIVYIFVGIR